MKKAPIKKYDLHMHSYYSRCSRNRPEDILKAAKRAGLDGIAITDHHTMQAYSILKRLNKDKDFEIIPGEEVTTQYGDVLGLYLKKEIVSREFFAVIKEIRSQGGIVIIPHPYRPVPWQRFRYPLEKLKGKIDALETFNSRNSFSANDKASRIAVKLKIPQLGSSDAHTIFDIGKGYTLFKDDLRKAIIAGKTQAGGTNRYGMLSGVLASFNKHILYPLLGGRAR